MVKKQKEGLTLASTSTRRFANTMVSPTVIILLVMTAYPLIFTLIYSFTDYNLMKRNTSFVALKNYADLLGNAYFRQAIWNTVKFTVLTVAFEMVCGFFLALFVNSLKKGQKAMRTLLLLPYLLPAVTVALSWKLPAFAYCDTLVLSRATPVTIYLATTTLTVLETVLP